MTQEKDNQDLRTSIIKDSQTTYKESRYRWVNFGIYILAALVNSLPTQTFSSINTLVTDNYSYDSILVTLNVLFFPILHPIFAFPANWILDKFGMKIGCSIGGLLVIAGVWLRTLLEEGDITWCLLGSILAAIGNVCILNSPSILANNWFKPSSIPGIISFSVLSNLISITLGSALPGLLIKQGDDRIQTQQRVQSFLRIEAIVITIPMIMMFLAFKTRPELPPSKAAQNQQKNKDSYSQLLRKLFKNKQYLLIMLVMTLNYGSTTSYLANLDQSLAVLGFEKSGQTTAEIILSAMLAGLFSSFFFIRKVKTTLQYKSVLCLCLLCSFLMFGLLQGLLVLRENESWAMYMMGAFTGAFLIPTTSLLMAYSSEVVYPLGEGSATGYLFAASQTFGFVLGIGSAAIIKDARNDDQPALWKIYIFMGIHALFYLGAFLIALKTSNMLNRTNYQQGHAKKEKQTAEGLIFSN